MANRVLFTPICPGEDTLAIMPQRKTGHSAGIDLFISHETTILPQARTFLRTSLKVQFPPRHFGLLMGKSSMVFSGLWIHNGVIDEDYTGEILIHVFNTEKVPVTIHRGQRIAQLLVQPYSNDLFLWNTGRHGEVPLLISDRQSEGFGVSNTNTLANADCLVRSPNKE